MGVSCFKSTPANTYSTYLRVTNIPLLKEQWSPLKLFKLKKIFQNNCHSHQRTKENCLNQATFIKLLLEFDQSKFNKYSDANKKRLFDLFDRENAGYLSWHNFFIGLTICEFAPDQILAVVLFAIFDTNLKQQLNMEQLLDLLNKNSTYLKEQDDETDIIDGQSIAAALLNIRNSIGIDEWIQKSQAYIDYFQFRKLFNIFEEEEMERQMAMNFNQINNLYNTDKGMYIGYVVNYKWFQSWKTYIYKEFNIQVNGFSENLAYIRTSKTLKSIKTKKTIRSMKSVKSLKSSKSFNSGKSNKKTIKYPTLLKEIVNIFKDLGESHMTQYNLIYSNIGDKPFQINNNSLEGQFSELLMPELVQNINYVLVSQEVWRRLKLIYGAYPQFRRTGEQTIEIYPKLFKVFTKIRNGRIDYEEEKVCEFSKFMQMDHLISKALEWTIEDLQNYAIFCKSCSNYKWEELTDLTLMASEVSSEQMVFMAIVAVDKADEFRSINCKIASTIKELHIGDQFLYCIPIQKTAIKAVFMGKDKYKIIIHFRGLSYIYDICIDRDQFYLRSKLDKKGMETTHRKVCMEELQLIGLANTKGLSFITSLLLSLLSNQDFTSQLCKFNCEKPTSLLQYMAFIFHLLSNSSHVDNIIISDMIRYFFTSFTDFEFTMGQLFAEQFMSTLYGCFQKQNQMINPIKDYFIQSQKVTICNLCHKNSLERNKSFSLTLSIPEEEIKYYQIIYVPFAYSLKSVEIKRYGFSLPKSSTMNDYKEIFQRVADLKDTPYVLTEIQGNNIIKNYLNAREDATLEDLLLREDDHIYAFQLCFKIDLFINNHYYNDSVIKLRNLKVGQLIDFEKEREPSRKSINGQIKQEADRIEKTDQTIMIFGKIVSIQTQSYTHKLILKVEHRENRGDIICSTINPENNNIAIFPTRSYLFAYHYHIRVLQRFYNQVSNQMQILSMPFIILITSWMRMKQLELLIYQQVRMLIHDDYKFNITQQADSEEGLSKINKNEKFKKFKQYLYGSNLPYEIKFTDLNGRCAVCCKIQKSKPREDEEEFTCCGCNLEPQLPIFWQIRPYQSRVCVDWRLPQASVKPSILDHSSFTVARSARKNCVLQLQDCINYRRTHGESDQCSCSFIEMKKTDYVEHILNNPSRVIITFDRVIEEDQNYKHISRKYIHFEMEQMQLNGGLYQLVAATSIEGSQMDAHYLTYIRNKSQWLEYKGENVRIVKKALVQKICALTLHYRKIGISFDQNKNNWK